MTIYGDPVVEECYMFERGIYFPIFHCLCFVNEISTYMLEGQVLEDRDPDSEEEEDIKILYISEEYWRDVSE